MVKLLNVRDGIEIAKSCVWQVLEGLSEISLGLPFIAAEVISTIACAPNFNIAYTSIPLHVLEVEPINCRAWLSSFQSRIALRVGSCPNTDVACKC